MGTLSNYVTMSITRNSVGITRAGFGTMLVLSYTAAWAERTRTYSDLAAVAADFATTSPEYLTARSLFSQSPAPEKMKVGRCALKPTLVYNFASLAAAPSTTYEIKAKGQGVTDTSCSYTTPATDVVISLVANATEIFTSVAHGMTTGQGPYRLTNAGGGLPTGTAVDTDYWVIVLTADTFQLATSYANAIALTPLLITTDGTGVHTLRRTTNDVIVSQLVGKLNAVVGKNFTAAQVIGAGETDSFTVTANTAGAWFSLELVTIAQATLTLTNTDPGIATDLANIKLADNDWYGLHTTHNAKATVLAAAAWVEANKKIYVFDTVENTDILTTSTGSSGVGDTLKPLAYVRTHGAYHRKPDEMNAAALYGKCLPLDPGSETWADKNLVGVTADPLTDTHRTNLLARNMNGYEDVAGIGITFDGRVSSGEFLDVTRFLDWFEDDCAKAVFGMKVSNSKVPQTDPGIAKIENEVRGSLARGVTRGGFAVGWTISVPKADALSLADKTARVLNGIKFSAVLQGAVHKINLVGSVSA